MLCRVPWKWSHCLRLMKWSILVQISPHGRFDHRKAHDLLNWQPRDGLEHLWQDNLGAIPNAA
jgi:hypothetical protein